MTYVVEDDFRTGVPQTILRDSAGRALALSPRALGGHWTAGGTGRQGAIDTITYFVLRADRNASYHEIWWRHPGVFGVRRCVRPERAAHGINPALWLTPKTGSSQERAEFNEIRRLLGDRSSDPNSVLYQVSFAGMPADLVEAMRDPIWLAGAVRRTRELQASFRLETRSIVTHGGGQPTTRYDWGTELRPALYAGLEEEDVAHPPLRAVRQEWYTRRDPLTPLYTGGPGQGVEKFWSAAAEIVTVAETITETGTSGNWRLAYVNGEFVWTPRRDEFGEAIFPKPGTRQPATGYGLVDAVKEVPTGITQQQLEQAAKDAAKAAAADVEAGAVEGAAARASKYGA